MTHGTSAETVGALIARIRRESGITQLRLAERLCACAGAATVTRHEVSRWEREERIPTGHWLAWLAVALDVPLADLERAAARARRARRAAPVWSPRLRADVTQRTVWRQAGPGVFVRVA